MKTHQGLRCRVRLALRSHDKNMVLTPLVPTQPLSARTLQTPLRKRRRSAEPAEAKGTWLLHDPRLEQHAHPRRRHAECPERIRVIFAALERAGLAARCRVLACRDEASDELLGSRTRPLPAAAHDAAPRGRRAAGGGGAARGRLPQRALIACARLAVDAVVRMAEAPWAGARHNGLALVRPAGAPSPAGSGSGASACSTAWRSRAPPPRPGLPARPHHRLGRPPRRRHAAGRTPTPTPPYPYPRTVPLPVPVPLQHPYPYPYPYHPLPLPPAPTPTPTPAPPPPLPPPLTPYPHPPTPTLTPPQPDEGRVLTFSVHRRGRGRLPLNGVKAAGPEGGWGGRGAGRTVNLAWDQNLT